MTVFVQDIYEATKFDPLVSSSVDADPNDKFHTCAIKFSTSQISVALRSRLQLKSCLADFLKKQFLKKIELLLCAVNYHYCASISGNLVKKLLS